jgi:hypothetical protein
VTLLENHKMLASKSLQDLAFDALDERLTDEEIAMIGGGEDPPTKVTTLTIIGGSRPRTEWDTNDDAN